MAYPVILIHGMWCTGANWKRVVNLMAPRGYDCLAPSLPAHDASPDQPLQVRALGLRDYVDSLEQALLTRADPRPPIIIGHSMGGLLAQQLAMRVAPLAMVLLAPAPPYGISGLLPHAAGAFLPWIAGGTFWRNAYKPGFARAQRHVFRGIPADRHRAMYEGMVHESGRVIFEVGCWPLDFTRASRVDASRVACPVYMVSCGKDRLAPASMVRKLARLYPQATQRYYPNRGHWVIDDEDTEEMMHSICGWLRPIEQKQGRGARA